MKKIISVYEAALISKKLKSRGKKIILTGGCFDILHIGHIKFLEDAKKTVGVLFVLLESDENIRRQKGDGRPLNSQKDRSIVLGALSSVDFIVTLRGSTKDEDYDKLIVQILPNYIAITKGDRNTNLRKKQCKMVGAELIEVDKLEGTSSTNFIEKIN